MLSTTHAILLKYTPVKDNRIIITAYTNTTGIYSFVFYRGNKQKKAYLMPLNQLEICYYEKGLNTDAPGSIKEIKIINPYTSVYTHIYKSAQLLFLNEILENTLKEQQQDINIFSFLTDTLNNLDKQEYNPWFHLQFLVRYMPYLGIEPDITKLNHAPYFDLEQGVFTTVKPANFINGNLLNCFVKLVNNNLEEQHNIFRKSMLTSILKYYQIHVPAFKTIKSAEILNEVLQ